MDAYAKEISSDKTLLFTITNAREFGCTRRWHTQVGWGGVMSRLGLTRAIAQETEKDYISSTLVGESQSRLFTGWEIRQKKRYR